MSGMQSYNTSLIMLAELTSHRLSPPDRKRLMTSIAAANLEAWSFVEPPSDIDLSLASLQVSAVDRPAKVLDARALQALLHKTDNDQFEAIAIHAAASAGSPSAAAMTLPLPTSAEGDFYLPVQHALTADIFDFILRFLPCSCDTEAALTRCQLVCRSWCCAARRVLSDPQHLATHLSLRTLLHPRYPAAAARCRLAIYPDEAQHLHKRRTILHAAIEHRAPIETIALLVSTQLSLAERADLRGVLPVHLAASVAAELCTPHGETAPTREGTSNGQTATWVVRRMEAGHLAEDWQQQCITLLLGASPQCRHLYSKARQTALHVACETGASARVVSTILGVVAATDTGGCKPAIPPKAAPNTGVLLNTDTPLPTADAPLASLSVALPVDLGSASSILAAPVAEFNRRVLQGLWRRITPAGLAALPSKNGAIALHLAARRGADSRAGVISSLLEAHPAGARTRDRDGLLPLHMAVQSGAPVAVVALLLDAFPIDRSWSPVDLLGLNHLGESFLHAKLAAEPALAAQPDAERRLLLHHAARSSSVPSIVAACAAVHPAATRQQDAYGKTPLHYALERQPDVVIGLIEVLLHAGRPQCLVAAATLYEP